MNRELQFYFQGLREYVVYILVFMVLLVLVFTFLIPQIANLSSSRLLLKEGEKKKESLEIKIKSLSALDKTNNKQKLQRLNLALPTEKDIGLMLGALELVAARANVRLGSFTLNVGGVSTVSPGTPSLGVALNLRGEISNVIDFIIEIKKTLPVMQINSFSLSGASATVSISYYFKPLVLQPVTLDTPLPSISTSQEDIYQAILKRETPPSIVEGQEGVREITPRENPFF